MKISTLWQDVCQGITFFKFLHVFHEIVGGIAHIFNHSSRIFGDCPQNNSNVRAYFVLFFFLVYFPLCLSCACLMAGATYALKYPHPIPRSDRHTNQILIKYHNLHTHTHTLPHTFTHDIQVHTWPQKETYTHRNYQPCLPQRHYGCHILCFHLLTGRAHHAVGHGLILLMMGIVIPETC